HLLRGQVVNENARFLAQELTPLGISVDRSVMLKEDTEDLKEALELAEKRSDLIVITGGLGPDKTDITKKTLSEYLNVPLVLDNETQNRIISYHQNSGLTMPKYNQLQAMILMNSTLIENVTGLAAGILYPQENNTYILLPGTFDELKPMFLEKASVLQKEKMENENSILTIENGEFIQGSPLSQYVKNHYQTPKILGSALNELDFDVSIIGNHEFNYGLDYLNEYIAQINHPVLSANILTKEGNYFADCPAKII